jgi:hypothetical protein
MVSAVPGWPKSGGHDQGLAPARLAPGRDENASVGGVRAAGLEAGDPVLAQQPLGNAASSLVQMSSHPACARNHALPACTYPAASIALVILPVSDGCGEQLELTGPRVVPEGVEAIWAAG